MKKSLWQLIQGEKCTISEFDQTILEDYQQRLSDLGFAPGEEVTCILSPKLGAPKLYQVNQACYSLDNKIAQLVKVI